MGRDSQWSVVWWTWFRDWRGFQWHGYTVLVKPMQTAHLASCFTFLWFGVIVKENYQQYEWSSLRSMHLTMRFDFHTEICRRSLMATSVQVDVSESPHHTDREGGPICGSFFFPCEVNNPFLRSGKNGLLACNWNSFILGLGNLILAPVLFTCESNIVLKGNDV